MKNIIPFKNYLLYEQTILEEYSKHPISELIAYGGIPLDPGMMDRLGFSEKEQLAYHLTNSVNLDDMTMNQGKKKQLSCFTKGGPELARLPSQPNILLMLKGDTVIKGDTDLWTLVSTRDKRWLDINKEKHSKLNFFIMGVLSKVAKKVDMNVDVYNTDPKTLAGMIEMLDKKDKIKLYKTYMIEMEKMLNKNYKILIEYLKTAADMKYNEVVLTKWEIMDSWCLEYEQPIVIEKLSELNIPYAGVMYRRDLSSLKI